MTAPEQLPPAPARCVLLTGFEPFGGDAVNPSMELLALFAGTEVGGHRVATALLPCCFGSAAATLQQAIAANAPALVLAVGQAGGRARLSFERVAVNLVDARIADNAGAQPVDEPVLAGAPPAYFATLPVKAMAAAAQASGVPAELSLSAGSYVCNAVFFELMHVLAAHPAPAPRGGFVHIPLLPDQVARIDGAPSMPLEHMARGIRAALEAALVTEQDVRVPGGTLC